MQSIVPPRESPIMVGQAQDDFVLRGSPDAIRDALVDCRAVQNDALLVCPLIVLAQVEHHAVCQTWNRVILCVACLYTYSTFLSREPHPSICTNPLHGILHQQCCQVLAAALTHFLLLIFSCSLRASSALVPVIQRVLLQKFINLHMQGNKRGAHCTSGPPSRSMVVEVLDKASPIRIALTGGGIGD